ncbi:MAG: TonB family protein [Candidatus Acidiferrales bacterium]
MRLRIMFGTIVFVVVFVSGVSAQTAPPAAQQSQQTQQTSPPQQSTPPDRIRISGDVQASKVIKMIPPVYPQIAKLAHIQGTVVLHAIIAKDGSVEDVQVVSGPPLLLQAAIDAVKQWRYQPTLLNGEPVKIDTAITVVFNLDSTSDSNEPPPTGGEHIVVPVTPIDPQLKANIAKLLDLMHATTMGQDVVKALLQRERPSLVASLPPTAHRDQIVDAYVDKLAALLSSQDFIDRLTALYAKYFSNDDVNALIQFYQSPVGQRSLSVMPQITNESSQIGEDVARENLPRIFQELCKEFPELQGQAKFCGPGTKEKSSQLIERELHPANASLSGARSPR